MRLFVSIVLCWLVSMEMAWAITPAEAVNQAGRQRMLSQRMMLSYLMIGADIRTDKAQQQLDTSVAQFEEQFQNLLDYAPNPQIQNRLNRVAQIWQSLRMSLLSPPNKAQASKLLTKTEALLQASEDVVSAIEKESGIVSAELVNRSGRQRMLSQRIAMFYLALYWGVSEETIQTELQTAINAYETALNSMKAFGGNDQEIKQTLDKIEAQWKFSKAGFPLQETGQFVPTVIVVVTESMLKKNDQLTSMYQGLMQKQLARN